MAKSEALTAWRPSLPLMPTPICASWIIATSLAPSPMDSVVTWSRFLWPPPVQGNSDGEADCAAEEAARIRIQGHKDEL